MKKNTLLLVIILALVLAGCAAAKSSAVESYPAPLQAPADRTVGKGGGVTTDQGYAGAPNLAPSTNGSTVTDSSVAAESDRMVVQESYLTIVVTDPQKKMDAISSLAKSMGGYVVSMNMSQISLANGDTAPQGTITVRVPSDQLEAALTQIKTGVVDVTSENRTGQDVTSQYVDLQSQLNNLEQAEKDLLDIMDEAKNNPGNDSTTKTQDVLNVYNQIVSIRGQIEQIKGQMQLIQETTSTASIQITLVAEKTIKPIEIGGWKPQGVARDAIQALVKFLQGFVNFVIYLVLLVLPILIVIFGPLALILWGILALVKRNRKKKNAPAK